MVLTKTIQQPLTNEMNKLKEDEITVCISRTTISQQSNERLMEGLGHLGNFFIN